MPSSTTFTGVPFTVSSVAASSTVTTIRVLFSAEPKHVNAYASDDALNSANYTLAGPIANGIIGVATVSGQPEAIDLILNDQLSIGVWNVDVSPTIISTTATPLTGSLSFSFTVAAVPALPSDITPGSVNDTAEDLIRQHMSPAFAGKAWDALIAAVATGDAYVFDNAAKAFYQLFVPTAEGKYLDARGSERGVARPRGLGMNDELYRQYISAMTNSQVTLPAAWKLLEVFWGKDAVSGYLTSKAEPFNLSDGQSVSFVVDRVEGLTVTFSSDDFNTISIANADEVSAVINKHARDNKVGISAMPVIDSVTGLRKVRVYSDAVGADSFMACSGGLAQNALQFETALITTAGFPISWTITKPTPSTVKFSTTSSNAILDDVRAGDYVNLTPFTYSGTYIVTDANVSRIAGLSQYFVFESDESFGASFSQTTNTEIAFYRPDTIGVSQGYGAVRVSTAGGTLNIEVPATSNTVGRTPETGGAYCKANSVAVNTDAATKWSHTQDRCEYISVTSAGHGTNSKSIIEDSFVSGLTPPVATSSFDAPSQSGGLGKADVRRWHVLGDWSNDPRWNTITLPFSSTDVIVAGGQIDSTPTFASDNIHVNLTETDYFYYTAPALSVPVIFAAGNTVPENQYDEWSPVLFGGLDATGSAVGVVQKMDPGTQVWSSVTSGLSYPRYNSKAVWIPTQNYFFLGPGFDGSTEVAACDSVTASTSWTVGAIPDAPYAVQLYGLDNMTDNVGYVYTVITGGLNNTRAVSRVQIYDHDTGGGWSGSGLMSDMLYARYNHASIMADDLLIVACGTGRKGTDTNASDTPLSSVEVLDTSDALNNNKHRWRRLPGTRRAHAWAKMVKLSDTEILLIGSNGAEILNLQTMRWTAAGFDENLTWGIAQADVSAIGKYVFAMNSSALATTYRPNVALAPGAKRIGVIGSCGIHPTVSASATTYHIPQYSTDFFSSNGASYGTHTKLSGVDAAIPGPYLFDPKGSFAVTGIAGTTSSAMVQNLGALPLTDASAFPQSGYLVIGLGYDYQTGPVEFYAKVGNTLTFDSSYPLTKDIPAGANVTLLLQKSPYAPAHKDGALYLTPSARGRTVAVESLRKIMAGGVGIDITVAYPGDRGLGKEGTEQSDKVYVWGNDEL